MHSRFFFTVSVSSLIFASFCCAPALEAPPPPPPVDATGGREPAAAPFLDGGDLADLAILDLGCTARLAE